MSDKNEVEDGLVPGLDILPIKSDPGFRLEVTAKLLVPLIVVLILVMGFFLYKMGNLPDKMDAGIAKSQEAINEVKVNRETGFRNRAVSCTLVIGLTGRDKAPKSCFDRDVLRYYNPSTVPQIPTTQRQLYTTSLVCSLVYPQDPVGTQKCIEGAS